MADVTEAPWLLLSDAERWFLKGGHPRQAFDALLKGGQVRVAGKRDKLNADPIEALLHWTSQTSDVADPLEALLHRASQISDVNVSIECYRNTITFDIDRLLRGRLFGASYLGRQKEADLRALGFEPRQCTPFSFHDVRVDRVSLIDRAAASGYPLPTPTKSSHSGQDRKVQRRAKKPKPPGPKRGTIARFAESDRKLFPKIERLMRKESLSPTEAVTRLAQEGKVKGRGTKVSSVRRVVALYRAERGGQ
jgi:hypothetical protein